MKVQKGIVCEITSKYYVFMTSDGQFLRGTSITPNASIGEEVEFYELVQTKPNRSRRIRYIAPIVAAAAILIITFYTIFQPPNSVLAYVQVEGNQSVELGITEDGKVVVIRELNKGQYDTDLSLLKGKLVSEVIEEFISTDSPEDIQQSLKITTVYTDDSAEKNTKPIVEQAISNAKVVMNEQKKEVKVFEATEEEREKANEKGVAIQRYLENPQKNKLDKQEKEIKKEQKKEHRKEQKKLEKEEKKVKKEQNERDRENRKNNLEKDKKKKNDNENKNNWKDNRNKEKDVDRNDNNNGNSKQNSRDKNNSNKEKGNNKNKEKNNRGNNND